LYIPLVVEKSVYSITFLLACAYERNSVEINKLGQFNELTWNMNLLLIY
jgi:hypothetical protein